MPKNLLKAIVVTAVAGLLASAGAEALQSQIGTTTVSATASFLPRTLPARPAAPVKIQNVTRIGTTNGSMPPKLSKLVFVFDKHGSVSTRGLPVCAMAKLAGTTPQLARQRCAGAVVGKGVGRAAVQLPGQPATELSSPLTFFNAPPVGGQPSLIAHAFETIPAAKTLLLPIAVERIQRGRYGYRVEIDVPEIAAGFGAATLAKATIGRTWVRDGRTVGYTNAYCAGGRLQVYGTLSFSDGGFFPGTLTSPCHSDR
jgi:hypothetical protein